MISKARLKDFSGYRLQKRCEAEGVFVVEGVKMVAEALRAGLTVHALCGTADWMQSNASVLQSVDCYEVGPADLERLSSMRSPNEVWLLASRPHWEDLPADEAGLTLVLDHLQDPGNLGTIIRTADWFGIRHIVCSPDSADCFNPKVVQATMGGIFRTRVEYCNLVSWLSNYPHPVYGALLDGDDVRKARLQRPAALVIGNESRGISQEVQLVVSCRIAIHNHGGTCESLNASVATAILCAEFYR